MIDTKYITKDGVELKAGDKYYHKDILGKSIVSNIVPFHGKYTNGYIKIISNSFSTYNKCFENLYGSKPLFSITDLLDLYGDIIPKEVLIEKAKSKI